ncbi:peptidylprolyl isomerase [bacterium]|nr:peptidylprolyl isomerase [bacterium]
MYLNFRFLACLLCLFLFGQTAIAQRQIIDRIAAVVDDEAILESEVQNYAYFEALNQKIDPEKNKDEYDKLERNILESLINQKILLAQAKLDSVTVDESQVESTLDQQIQQRVQQAGGEDALEKYLGKKISEIRKLYRNNVRKQLLTQKIQSSRFQDVKISRSEVETFFKTFQDSLPEVGNSINMSHILMEVKAGDAAYEEARKLAATLLDSLKRGGDFAALAKKYSNDPSSAKKGGELGWFNRADFVKEFAEAAVKLEPGEISDIVKTQFGYHIIQLIQKSGDKINTRHILIGVNATEDDKKATIEKLKQIRQDILDGKTTLEEAALKYSDDPAKKGNLGNLGWIEISTFQDKAFLQAAQSLKTGEISEPFETSFGYHIVKLNDRREKRKMNLREDWQSIENMAMNQKQAKEMDHWLKEIRSKFYVDVRM